MTVLEYVRRLYSLDTLDTRFTSSPKTPPSQLSAGRSAVVDGRARDATQRSPSRWKTPEFIFYAVVFVLVVPMMFYTVYAVSTQSNPEYVKFEPLLSPGWIPGRQVDNSDMQYSNFRENLPYLFIVVALHPALRWIYGQLNGSQDHAAGQRKFSTGEGSESRVIAGEGDARLASRVDFDLGFGLLFLFALHGTSAPKVLLILLANYMLALKLDKAQVPVATWIFNVGILFSNELAQGYRYADLLAPFSGSAGSLGSRLDLFGGLVPRWEVLFKVTILRLISFNFDRLWAEQRSGSSSPVEKKQLDPADLSDRDRVSIPARTQDYTFRNYLAYALYSPLYLAGPILTFNDYISQQKYKPKSLTFDRTLRYGIRFGLALLAMEVMIHFIYVVAISKADPAWDTYSPFQLSMLGYFHLHHIWLKLLLPWRFFRLWAVIDGIDPPENMVRCMSDNYSTLAFWRGWHRSYNRWIVRYIYIPLGGSSASSSSKFTATVRSIVNMVLVFSFVAIWHDIQLHLLVWGWLVVLFFLPEMIAVYLFPKSKWRGQPETFRMLCGIGAVGNVLMMMSANLVGFAVGLDGFKDLVSGIVSSFIGVSFFVAACACLFIGVQVMFETRQNELRQGVNMKC